MGSFLAAVMGVAAVFTATNTMLAAIASRTREIGILKSIGFRPAPIFFAFLLESLMLSLAGGWLGGLLILPVNGIETGTMNFNTFTDVAFAFRVTPKVLMNATFFALVLGLVGGAWPAWRASQLEPVEALRRG
jgi:putative ABC transport system permease protein